MPSERRKFALLVAAALAISAVVLGWNWWRRDSSSAPGTIAVAALDVRSRLVATLEVESLSTTVERLPRFDDTVWVLGDVEPDNALSQTSYRHQSQFVPSLNRVRKILEEARANGADVGNLCSSLLSHFERAIEGFGPVLRLKHDQIDASSDAVLCAEPDEYWSRVVFAPATAYLLAELNFTDALPRFSETLASNEVIPVNRIFLFYAAHRLATRYPRDSAPRGAQIALDAYLRISRDVPGPEKRSMLSWNSPFDSDDYRLTMLHRTPSHIDRFARETIFYPSSLNAIERGDETKRLLIESSIAALRRFVSVAYGN